MAAIVYPKMKKPDNFYCFFLSFKVNYRGKEILISLNLP